MNNWIKYWENKGKLKINNTFLLSDYNVGLSYLSKEGYKFLIKDMITRLKFSKNDKLLDVGCGCGLFTIELSKFVESTVGLDSSATMLSHIKNNNIRIVHSEARNIPFENEYFDKVVCHSIFQYFPNLSYAKDVIKEFIRVCKRGGIIYILDIQDEDTKDEYLKLKKMENPSLKRLFFKRDFFKRFLPDSIVFSRLVPGYGNSKYRFNVLFTKKN